MNRNEYDYDVAIVGYGPVGAAAALMLAHEGLSVAVFDRSPDVYDLPRAVALDGEIVRAFQRIGLGDTVAACLQPWREGDCYQFVNSRYEPYFSMDALPTGANGWRDMSYFDQPEFEALLREQVSRRDGIDVFLGCEAAAFTQDDDGVTLSTRPADDEDAPTRQVRVAWLIGCDGASSFVRRSLEIGWHSLGYDQDWLVVDIVADANSGLPIEMMQLCDPARIATYIPVKDPYRRWEFRLLAGETREEMVEPERVRALLDAWLAPELYSVRRAVVYQFHAATASSWHRGRVFLAGDAAHQTPPFLGQGLNAGVRDAVNLGWKLPMVCKGLADASLLDSYEAERDPHARDLVEWAVAVGRLMEAFAAQEAGHGPADFSALMSSGYGQGRTAPPLRGGVIAAEQVSDAGDTGYLLPQPRVRARAGAVIAGASVPDAGNDAGEAVLLDQLLGQGFAVVVRDAGIAAALGDGACDILTRRGVVLVDVSALEVATGSFAGLLDRHAAVIVRPDRYVFATCADAGDLESKLERLDAALCGKAA